jgi:putative flippase GtrA
VRSVTSSPTRTADRFVRHSAVRFVLVSGLSFTVDLGALALLHGVLGVWLPVAAGLAYGLSAVLNFGLSRHWVFAGGSAGVSRQLTRYIAMVAGNLALTAIGVPALTGLGLPYLISKPVVATALGCAGYLVARIWIFRTRGRAVRRAGQTTAGRPVGRPAVDDL